MIAKLVIPADGTLPFIISDEKPVNGDRMFDYTKGRTFCTTYKMEQYAKLDGSKCYKVIAGHYIGLPDIDWNGLEEEFGYIHWSRHWEKVNRDFKEGVNPHAYRRGFKDAQALNEKKYTLEDIKKAFYQGWTTGLYLADDNEGEGELDKIIHALSQLKIFPIEIELNLPIQNANELIQYGESPVTVMKKLTSNSVKILRRL